ncbi:MAG: ribosome maturation factor RimM [Halanaerobiales bacterium]
MPDMITIGKITRYHGNRGEVRVLPLTDDPGRFELLSEVYLDCEKKLVEATRYHKHYVILKFRDINDIAAAESLKDKEIKIPENELLPLAEDEYYIYQLLDYRVITVKNSYLGQLEDIITTPGTDIFLVRGKDKYYQIPAASEFVVEINRKKQEIRIEPIPGLLDL